MCFHTIYTHKINWSYLYASDYNLLLTLLFPVEQFINIYKYNFMRINAPGISSIKVEVIII